LATNSEDWRDLMTPKELAAYKAGGYGDGGILPKTAPKGSVYMERDKREVSFNEAYAQHQPGAMNENATFRSGAAPRLSQLEQDSGDDQVEQPPPTVPRLGHSELSRPMNELKALDPDVQAYNKQAVEAVDGLAGIPAHCVLCGEHLAGDQAQKRVTILLHDGKDKNRAVVYCASCFALQGVQLTPADDWAKGLTQEELRVWNVYVGPQALKQREISSKLGIHARKVSRIINKVRDARTRKGPQTPVKSIN